MNLARLARLADPYYLARRALARGLARHAAALQGRLLDIGCGARPYQSLFAHCDYLGIELMRDSPLGSPRLPDVYYDGRRLPLRDGCADALLCTQVLEHVAEPAAFVAELRRVLKPGGRLLLTVPFVWDEHEQPYDYARYTSFGLRHLFESGGFKVLELERTLADPGVLVQLALAALYKQVRAWPKAPRTAILAAAGLPGNLAGLLLQAMSRGHADLYLDNIALLERRDEPA